MTSADVTGEWEGDQRDEQSVRERARKASYYIHIYKESLWAPPPPIAAELLMGGRWEVRGSGCGTSVRPGGREEPWAASRGRHGLTSSS